MSEQTMPETTMPSRSSRDQKILKRLSSAAEGHSTPREKAEAAVWAAVLLNIGIGAIPIYIDVGWTIATLALLIAFLGELYGYTYSKEQAAALLWQLVKQLRFSHLAFVSGLKVLSGSAAFVTAGGATPAGLAVNGFMNGVVTYALGYTAIRYFEKNRDVTTDESRAEFRRRLSEGRLRVQAVVLEQGALARAEIGERLEQGWQRTSSLAASGKETVAVWGSTMKRHVKRSSVRAT